MRAGWLASLALLSIGVERAAAVSRAEQLLHATGEREILYTHDNVVGLIQSIKGSMPENATLKYSIPPEEGLPTYR